MTGVQRPPGDDDEMDGPSDHLAVLVEDEGVLVTGDRAAVDSWVAAARGVGAQALDATGLTTSRAADLAALGTAAASVVSLSGTYVRLSPASWELLKTSQLVPGADGFFRMFTHTQAGKIAGQLQWKVVPLGPQAAIALQSFAATTALRAAIASVEDAVERVEGKVEAVLALASAERTGDVLGHHYALAHTVELVSRSGRLPSADWESVAGLGPVLTAAVEKLRSHARILIESLDPNLPAQERANKLKIAVKDGRLGETLQLLLIAEDSLYLWQTLRVERVSATEPDSLAAVSDSARTQLREHANSDQQLLEDLATRLTSYAAIRPLELHRKLSARHLAKDLTSLRADLDSFATQRQLQIAEWGRPALIQRCAMPPGSSSLVRSWAAACSCHSGARWSTWEPRGSTP